MILACGGARAEPLTPHETFTLESKALAETRRINVYLPPVSSGARLPVLYMPDGGLEEDFPHVAADVDAAIRAGAMRPTIVVGVENTERRRDMTGPTAVESDRAIAPRVGGSAAFRAFFRDELIPEIERRYPASDERAIVGESLAGLFVVETFFEAPGLFDVSIALSPSLWWNDRALATGAAERLRSGRFEGTTLYLTHAGDDDRGGAIATFAAALKAESPHGLTWFFEPRADLRHDTIYREASPAIFRKLLPAGSSAPSSVARP